MGIASFEESSQCQPVALRGDLETESLANSREEVDVLGEGVDNPPASRARPGGAHDARHSVALLEEAELVRESVVSELIAMIRGDKHESVLHWPSRSRASQTRPSWASTSPIIP